MIVDLNAIDALEDKERRHLELSIYVGYGLERAQKFEQLVGLVIALANAQADVDDDEQFRADIASLMSKRLVDLLARCVDRGLISTETAEACEEARKRRNKFVHQFFRDHDLHSKEGYQAAFWDAQQVHSLMDAVCELLTVAVQDVVKSLGYTAEEFEEVRAHAGTYQGEAWA